VKHKSGNKAKRQIFTEILQNTGFTGKLITRSQYYTMLLLITLEPHEMTTFRNDNIQNPTGTKQLKDFLAKTDALYRS
jgi:hypothetical protein